MGQAPTSRQKASRRRRHPRIQATVIPAKAGIQSANVQRGAVHALDSRLRGNDRRLVSDAILNGATTGQICEYAAGVRITFVMLETISSKAYLGELESVFHSGAARKASHFLVRSARSSKQSM